MQKIKKTILRITLTVFLGAIFSMASTAGMVSSNILSPVPNEKGSAVSKKQQYQVFGFAPYWTINKLDNIDYSVLTTLAYFGVPVNTDGSLDREDVGYATLSSTRARRVFDKAQSYGTRVVLTITQMKNANIEAILEDPQAQKRSIRETVALVREHGLDGINVDFEYMGNPGDRYKDAFTKYVKDMTTALHSEVPGSQLTVSVYASAMKDPKIYDIGKISEYADAIFMMAYDFATSASDHVIPTAPLYGYREGKYWYDISTAVEDFLAVMPSEKLILGLPWYGYKYPVTEPGVKVAKYQGSSYYYYYRGRRYRGFTSAPASSAVTYATATQDMASEKTGWDDSGKVGWRAYQANGVWHMMFLDDARSLGIKYDFAKEKNLAGVGVWALGFDVGTSEMWSLLSDKFGEKLAYSN